MFNFKLEHKWLEKFDRELDKNLVLYYFVGFLLFYTFVSFYDWSYFKTLTQTIANQGYHTCWPYFQSCGNWYVFEMPPIGYGIKLFFALVFLVWFIGVYAWLYRQYKRLWLSLAALLLLKILVGYIYTYELAASYDFFHIFFLLIVLLVPGKSAVFFLQLFLALSYWFSASIKIDSFWLAGDYFEALGLPFIENLIPAAVGTKLLFLLFCLVPIGLFCNAKTRIYTVWTLIGFHLYTMLFVGIHYPVLMIPALWILFVYGPFKQPKNFLKSKAIGITLLLFSAMLHFWSFVIPGNEKYTGEGVRYGLYMFDADRQCKSEAVLTQHDGSIDMRDLKFDPIRGRRCYVYREWFFAQQLCKTGTFKNVGWNYWHRNGNNDDWRQLVQTDDVCALEFTPWWHNEWIDKGPKVFTSNVVWGALLAWVLSGLGFVITLYAFLKK